MINNYTEWDFLDDQERAELKAQKFFGEFSSEARNKLMSKNLVKPQNLYDVYYTNVRKDLLSKNANTINTNIDDFSKTIRDTQLAKSVSKIFSLEEQSEDFRNSLLSRNKLYQDVEKLAEISESRRKDLLGKNAESSSDLLKDSELYRRNELALNKSYDTDLDDKNKSYRENELALNVSKETSLEKDSKVYRSGELALNKSKENDLEKTNEDFRADNLAHNKSKSSDLQIDSEGYRRRELSLNTSKDTNIEKDSKSYRENELALNKSKDTDLSADSVQHREDELALNKSKDTDLNKDSAQQRADELALNKSKNADLSVDSAQHRAGELALNKSKNADLSVDSAQHRTDELALNKSKDIDLSVDSVQHRTDELALNKSKGIDLGVDSAQHRTDELALNKSKGTDLENDSELYRKNELSLNSPTKTDLEKDSEKFRSDDLSLNTPKTTDLEKANEKFRADELALNKSKGADLLKDSEPYKDNELALNKSKSTDLIKDSELYKNNELALNISKSADLLKDSELYKNNELALNVSKSTDLEKDEKKFRDDELAKNVSKNTDLLKDSESYKKNELAKNVSKNTDLLKDSESYKKNELALNVPNNTDLEKDNKKFRDDELAKNVPSNIDLNKNSKTLRDSNLSKNVDGTQSIDSSADPSRKLNSSKNVSSQYSIDNNIDQFGLKNSSEGYRKANLAKNSGGMLGYNIMAFGTSQFIGVSGVWAQGLLFRNLLLLRNRTKYDINDSLLRDTLNVPTLGQIRSHKALPITPKEVISEKLQLSKYPQYDFITSPIERNLTTAFEEASFYGIAIRKTFGIDKTYSYYIDYKLNNNFGFSSSLKELHSFSNSDYGSNVNKLLRDYLKYSNPFNLDDKGSLNKQSVNIASIANRFQEIANSNDIGADTIRNLINDYNVFTSDSVKRMLKAGISLNAPDGIYFPGDIEKSYDVNYGNDDDTSIVFKKYLGNPTDDLDFKTGKKGVKNILKRIAIDNTIQFAANYQNIQGPDGYAQGEFASPKIFFIGKKTDGSAKTAQQKFTIKNPYAPQGAGKLIFYFKNYSNGQTMYFPPYIESFQNSESANWNSNTFLGRPEPVYTYNNSNRDGSVSFFVLTDYAEDVLIGRNQTGSMPQIKKKILENFTDNGPIKKAGLQMLQTKLDGINKQIADLQQKNNQEQNASINTAIQKDAKTANDAKDNTQKENNTYNSDNTTDENSDALKQLNDTKIKLEQQIFNYETQFLDPNYSEAGKTKQNIYMNIDAVSRGDNGDVESAVGDTVDRINTMIQTLSFQPAFFSGSKVDFKRKCEFLTKMTRPAANSSGSGFSFTKPPVCHLRLGEWLNHDIIINSVSYNYENAPWTIDSTDIAQPMWANVSVQFNIVGPAGMEGGVPLLSTDKEGFFGTKTVR